MENLQTKKRVSLTKKQAESQIGQELISICMTFVDDGELSDEEIESLRDWLATNHESIAAIDYLGECLSTYDKQRDKKTFYEAIEKILPTDERKTAKDKRKTVEKYHKQRNNPIAHFNFMVTGCRFEGRDRLINKYAERDDIVILEREHSNPHDKNAVQVQTRHGHHIGYVPREDASGMAKLMTADNKYVAYFSKLLNNYSTSTIPVVDATFYKIEADEDNEETYIIPSKGTKYSASGCGLTALVIAAVVFSTTWLLIN